MSSNEEYITPEEVKTALESLEKEEIASKKRLAEFSCQWHTVIQEVDSVIKQFSSLNSVKENIAQVQTRIRDSSVLAEEISSKVRQLDKIRVRVSECQQRVQDLLDLRLCSEGVQIAMENDELEQAAAHVHRYLSIDQTKLQRTADDMAQDCSMITSALQHLHDATQQLQDTVSRKFEHASRAQDSKSVERYFKIFPLLNMHDVGLAKFADYLGAVLKVSADKSLKTVCDTSVSSNRASIVFADGLTFVFEEVAKTIEVQQPLIETHYGPEYVYKFLSHLQVHCDAFSSDLLQAFAKARGVKELLKRMWDESADANVEKPDSKDIDLLVEETVLMLARYDLYSKFVCKRINADLESKTGSAKTVLSNSKLCCAVQELMGKYLEMERYYMEQSIGKAMMMDTIEGEGDALTSSMVDDVFFIVRKCVIRSLRSGSLDVLCAVINNAVSALDTEMCTFFARTLAAGYPGSGYFNRFAADLDKSRQTFLAALNNTEVAVEYCKSLAHAFRDEIPAKLADCNVAKLDSCLNDFSRVNALLVAANKSGFLQLHASWVEPKMVAWIEPFYEQNYKMTEAEFAQAEADNPFVQALVLNVGNAFREFKARLTHNNYEVLVVAVAAECAIQLEKAVMKTEFNRLGSMALDKVVRTLIKYFSVASAFSPVREKFWRLVQITYVLNIERVSDIYEYLSPDSGLRFEWKLTPDTIKQILKLRSDFHEEDIRKIKF